MKIPNLNGYKYRGHFLGWGSDPLADWKIMFSVFLISLLALALWSAYIFMGIKDMDAESGASAQDALIDEEKLRRTAGYYEKLKLDFEALRTRPETTPDPSI